MSERHQFQDLTKGFTPERRRRVEAKKVELLAEMPLRELRQAMALTQQDLAVQHAHLEPPCLYRISR